jgi:hypothetical protein
MDSITPEAACVFPFEANTRIHPMNQQQLFYDTIFDALGADIAACGGIKVVAGKLWESESVTSGSQKLRNALNPEQPHKLCPTEVLMIKHMAKAVGSFATVNYEARELAFDVTWIRPEDEAERIHQRAVKAMEELQKELRRSNELLSASRSAIRAVK